MPIFEYACTQCGHQFEAIVRGSEKPHCPKCESARLDQKLSVFAVAAKNPAAASTAPNGGCCACGDPRGPCSLED